MSPHQQRQGYRPSTANMYTGLPEGLYSSPLPPPSAPIHQSMHWNTEPPSQMPEQRHVQAGWYPVIPTPSINHPVPASSIQYPSYPGPTRAPPPAPTPAPPPPAPASAPPKQAEPLIGGLKQVTLPRECLPRFIAIAKGNTSNNKETCGLLLGKDKGHKFVVTTLLIPRQHSTSDTCTMDEEELVLQFTEERNLITLGWVSGTA
jgi:STAM-binding protein